MLCAYFYSPEHVTKDFSDLLKKWEENKTNCNMVHVEPCKNKKKNEEVDIWVVTLWRGKDRGRLDHGEGSGKKMEREDQEGTSTPSKF
jgi:hypothetical protein